MDDSKTADGPADAAGWAEAPPRYSETRRVISVFFGRPLPIIGLFIIVAFVLTAISAPLIAPHDPYKMNIVEKLGQPSYEHLLGTDSLGRDTLSRIIYGSRTSLIIGISAICVSSFIGLSLGLIAAFFYGVVPPHHEIHRCTDGLSHVAPRPSDRLSAGRGDEERHHSSRHRHDRAAMPYDVRRCVVHQRE